MTVTRTAFDALGALMSMRDGTSRDCARLVLVDGMSQAAAARQTGLSRQEGHQPVVRAYRTMALAILATPADRSGNQTGSPSLAFFSRSISAD